MYLATRNGILPIDQSSMSTEKCNAKIIIEGMQGYKCARLRRKYRWNTGTGTKPHSSHTPATQARLRK
ncbi:predicted protein [Botrytis cinerea T4]|uniref:Uncharacterized protein n=1 Tax=Botryotinia fuckeliana (strain T4) TaxID=999810 RepID=G2YDU4_BOTF4|nr:predicted protein [Botrytis cinerea T4]